MGNLKSIKISEELHNFLMKQGVKGDTFEEVIWSLIGNKQMTKETEKDFKEAKKSYEASL